MKFSRSLQALPAIQSNIVIVIKAGYAISVEDISILLGVYWFGHLSGEVLIDE